MCVLVTLVTEVIAGGDVMWVKWNGGGERMVRNAAVEEQE